MIIKTYGARGFTCQVNRIDEGLRNLGCEVIQGEDSKDNFYYDGVYCNDPSGYKSALDAKADVKIFNVLDIPEHLMPQYYTREQLNKLGECLKRADIVTSISVGVRNQIKKYFNIESKVIYNPIRNLKYSHTSKSEHFRHKELNICYIGRARDPNKRFNLVIDACNHLTLKGYKINLKIAGSENPNTGTYLGVIPDEKLEKLYKESHFLIFPSKFEGLGLPPIEAAKSNCIPILCDDAFFAHEFYNKSVISKPSGEDISETVIKNIPHINKNYATCHFKNLDFKDKFNKDNVAKRIINLINEYKKIDINTEKDLS